MSRESNAPKSRYLPFPEVRGYDRPEDVVKGVGTAKIVIGIPSRNSAHTIAYVLTNAAKGIRKYYEGVDAAIIVCDGLSSDATVEVVKAVRGNLGIRTYVVPNVRAPGKGAAMRTVIEVVSAFSDAEALIFLDSDLRSVTPEWVAQLVKGATEFGFATPRYVRDRFDATITNFIARPLTAALYGIDLKQPIGGDFGLGRGLVVKLADSPLWTSNPWTQLFGVDIFITHTALAEGIKVCEANLKAKIHDVKDPAAGLKSMFIEVVGSLLNLMIEYYSSWSTKDFTDVVEPEVIEEPEVPDMRPWRIKVDTAKLAGAFEEGLSKYYTTYCEVLGKDLLEDLISLSRQRRGLSRDLWCAVVVKYVASFLRRQSIRWRKHLLETLIPLWRGRLLNYVQQVKELSDEEVEDVLKEEVAAFVKVRGDLKEVVRRYID